MHRIKARAAIACAFLSLVGCGLVLGLDGVRPCEGVECDASVGVGGDAASTDAADAAAEQDAGWTPAAFGADLAVWFSADYGVVGTGAAVSAWKDRAHAGVAISQGSQPTLDKQVAGNQDAIHFTLRDSVLQMKDSTDIQIATTDAFLIEVVARANVLDDTWLPFWAKVDTNGSTFGQGIGFLTSLPSAAGNLALHMSDGDSGYDVPSGSTPFKDGAFHIVGVRRSLSNVGSTTRFNVDGNEAMGGADNVNVDVSASGIDALIGYANPTFVDASACDYWIAEIIIVKRPTDIAPVDMAHVFTYLKAKYGL